jgi:S-DNA-T family DNA segregation ATPase FtsK/SpoIIIE
MARTATKRRPPSRPAARPRSRPKPAHVVRAPLFSAELKRELIGVAAVGVALILAAVLFLPGTGTVARPVHDALYAVLGAGAWLGVLALGVTGVRLCASHEWRAGEIAAAGSIACALGVLGLIGLVSPGSAGDVGRWLGPGIAQAMGHAGAGAFLIALSVFGLVMATDLRMRPIAHAVRGWMRRPERQHEEGQVGGARFNETRVDDPVAELPGVPLRKPFEPPNVDHLPPEAFSPHTNDPVRDQLDRGSPQTGQFAPDDAGADDALDPPFPRQFEGVITPPKELGPVPELSAAHAMGLESPDEMETVWALPTVELLDTVTGKRERLQAEVRVTGEKIVSTLLSFGIETRIVGANSGPTVTQYELQPAVGVPVRKILGYQTDLALALAAPIRIQPFIPGKSAIGVEVPNKAAQLVSLKEIVASSPFSDARNRLSVALGADVSGHPVVGDLTRMPHLLIAGATGSGKSVCINALLGGFLLQATPTQLKMILIDPKRVELSNFADLPHLLVPVVVEPEAAVASLRWAVKEMEERYKLFASHGARNIAVFNERASGLGLAALPYIVIVVDELADLMMVAAGEIEDLVCRIAQLARAVGIHLIVATQRPSADIITGLIKANIPSRIAFAVSSGVDSRVILDEMGAEKLLGRGDMLYLPIDEGKPRRLQGAYVSDRELDSLIAHWKAQGKPDYQEEIFTVEATVSWAKDATKRDALFAKAAHTVAAEGRAAASLLQRKLNVGYTRAARLIDQLAEHGVVGPYEGSKSREVRMDVFQVDELLESLGDE